MPASRERVLICPNESGEPLWMGPPPLWWKSHGLWGQYGARLIDTLHPVYVDYGALLTPGEVLAWDEECRTAFSQDPRAQEPATIVEMAQWRDALARARWIIVELDEWESGLA